MMGWILVVGMILLVIVWQYVNVEEVHMNMD